MTEESGDQPIVKESTPINNIEDSQTCTVHQGDNLTLVACDKGYELYGTQDLATLTKGIPNYGETRPATAVRNSLEKDKHGQLTYLIDGRTVITANWDAENGVVVKKTMMNLALEEDDAWDTITDMFVFDDMVVIRVDNGTFKFFPIPLVAGTYSDEVPLDTAGSSTGMTFSNYDEILAYGMHENTDDIGEYVYEFFAVLETELVKVLYQHDVYESKITQVATSKALTSSEDQFKGTQIRAAVSKNDFLVSCSDCAIPSVKFFDHELDLIHTMDVEYSKFYAYELAVHDQHDLMSLQTYIAGYDSIRVMLQVTDMKGKNWFKED